MKNQNTHRFTRTRLASVLIAGALGVAACGGSDGDGASLSGDDKKLAEALTEVWEADSEFPEEVSVSCLANGLVSGVGGASGAERYGVNVDNVGDDAFDENPLERGDALAAADQMFACDGFKSAFIGAVSGVSDADELTCLTDAIEDQPIEALFASTFMGDNGGELEEEYENAFEADLGDGLESSEIGV